MILTNAFSFGMLHDPNCIINVEEVSLNQASIMAEGCTSYVGNFTLASVFSKILGVNVKYNRNTFYLKKGDHLLLGHYKGPKLEDSSRWAPIDCTITWLHIILG